MNNVDYGLSPEQYHAGIQRLWVALGVHGPQEVDVFTLCASEIATLRKQLDELCGVKIAFDVQERMLESYRKQLSAAEAKGREAAAQWHDSEAIRLHQAVADEPKREIQTIMSRNARLHQRHAGVIRRISTTPAKPDEPCPDLCVTCNHQPEEGTASGCDGGLLDDSGNCEMYSPDCQQPDDGQGDEK